MEGFLVIDSFNFTLNNKSPFSSLTEITESFADISLFIIVKLSPAFSIFANSLAICMPFIFILSENLLSENPKSTIQLILQFPTTLNLCLFQKIYVSLHRD